MNDVRGATRPGDDGSGHEHEPGTAPDGQPAKGPARKRVSSTEVTVEVADTDACRDLGRALGAVLRAGDLVVLTGRLGAGKTTLTQGIGAGLGVRGPVASPTFIIARVHPSLVGGPALVHVDAYRLTSLEELDALDLDADLDSSVTVVEWGEGLAEVLSEDRLEVVLERPHGSDGDPVADAEAGTRRATVRGVGPRWAGVILPR